FDPQGSREPRQKLFRILRTLNLFRSTRLSRASTSSLQFPYYVMTISIHKALASLDIWKCWGLCDRIISIHKALASLDQAAGRCTVPRGISIHKALASL
ncbi:hypothetical protein CLOSYM_03847, partial [[Clostridium] symbiosum ATCC 14940]